MLSTGARLVSATIHQQTYCWL